MPATVIPVKGMQLGFIGNISNEGYSLRTPRFVNATDTKVINFGETLVLNTNNTYSSVAQFIASGGTFTAALAMGIAVANVKTNTTYPNNGGINVNGGFYQAGGRACDALVQGTINVSCNNGTPTAGGNVYLRTALNGGIPAGVIGGLEAVADGANTVLLTNLKWKTGYLETDTTAQVTILNRTIA